MNKNPKIVVASPLFLSKDQMKRIHSLGNVEIYNEVAKTPDEWLERCKDADIICSGKIGLQEKIYDLQNVFLSLPFVAVGWIDKNKLKQKNITVSYCPGCNRYAVSEWIIAMMLNLLRKFDKLTGAEIIENNLGSKEYFGLKDKKITILGKGNIGTRVGEVANALGMIVAYFQKGDNLIEKTKSADVVVNTLSQNPTTEGLLDEKFFNSLKRGSCFITVTSSKIYDVKAMLKALDDGILAGVADDCGSATPGDYEDSYYKNLLSNPKVLATPHISYQSDVSVKMSNDMMIDNIEAWIKARPINLLK